ncbi:hypothetical protein [Filimonas effusa]|uniref:DUF5723 domain-containing protein n=1 Tax=Filimonas effusa TaxID=2508721 RepID=A0A4Q1D0Z2_9BACT|nr:hypothetical protein [Filimonas effusa]RXK80894.1 hypothetical protein ESB13_22325 [Filimonas effusa]
MTCRTFCLMLVVAGSLRATAQEQSAKQQPAHIGLSYPISSNGKDAANYTNNFSAHALVGVSRIENGFAMAGIGLLIKDSANGVQLSGLINRIGNNARGVQAAGIANTMKNSYGFAAAGIANKASGNAEIQLAGVVNVANNAEGMQAAGIVNLGHKVRGLQLAGVSNTAEVVTGMQLAGIVNVAGNTGSQVAGIFNRAKNLEGIQVAGLVNKAAKVNGIQVSGLLNIADSSDYPIGIINIIRNGSRYISVSIDESATMLASFRSGGRVLYGIVGLGYNARKTDGLYAAEAGVGANLLQRGDFGVQAEVAGLGLFDMKGGEYYKSMLRVLPSWSFGPRWRVWAGPSFAYIHTDMKHAADLISNPIWEKVKENSIEQLAWGFVGGVQVKL